MIECKNPHCKMRVFVPVVEMDNNRLIGIKCTNCGARYSMDDLEIIVDRQGFWNSVIWKLHFPR